MRSNIKEMLHMENKCYTEVYSRVTGFYRPSRDYNPGKKEEFKDRKHFDIKKENKECSTTQN